MTTSTAKTPDSKASFAAIRAAVKAGIARRLHKGDLQDLAWAAVGRRDLTIDEAACAWRALARSGYEAPVGFAPRPVLAPLARASVRPPAAVKVA